jgi:protein-S-isoprenylcysteine O-methyltransferase Ste14
MTAPLPFAWPWALVFWAVNTWVYMPEFRVIGRSVGNPVPAEDRGSMRVLLVAYAAAIFAAFLLPFFAPSAALPGDRRAWFVAGLLLMIAGTLLRRHCFRVLGAFFTGAVTIQAGHRVIDSGAYRWVRHPGYSAGLLIVLGTAVACGNWLGVAVSFVLAFAGYFHRARIEEQALLASLGEPYARFMATRRRFIPFVV